MKIIDRFAHDPTILLLEFQMFAERSGRYICDTWASSARNSLETFAQNSSAEAFVNWAWSEYPEYRKFQIVESRFIVLDDIPCRQEITVVDLFSSGWQYHCDLLRKRGIYIGETYAGHEVKVNIYDVLGYDGDGCRIHSMTNKDAVDRIDDKLRELGLLPPKRGYQYLVSPREEDKPFYETYAEAIQYLKERIMSSKDTWENMDLLNRMGLGKWVPSAKLEGGAK